MDTPVRSLAKTLSWRALATLITATLTVCITGSWELGLALGTADTVVKLFIYYGHERAWSRITWEKSPSSEPESRVLKSTAQ